MKQNKKILLLLGGRWHDFKGFSKAMESLVESQTLGNGRYLLEVTYEPKKLLHLKQKEYDLVISYTCFSEPHEQAPLVGPDKLNEAQVKALTEWVRNGGALLAVHAATVMGDSHLGLKKLIGGSFVSHPEPFAFTVTPLYEKHPIIDGIEAFTVHDEFFIQEYDPSVRLHMVAIDRGTTYPMVWSKTEEKGKVVHIAMGHDTRVWEEPSYQRLMLQAIDWLL